MYLKSFAHKSGNFDEFKILLIGDEYVILFHEAMLSIEETNYSFGR